MTWKQSLDVQYSSKVSLPDENYLNINRLGSHFYLTLNSMNSDHKDQQRSVCLQHKGATRQTRADISTSEETFIVRNISSEKATVPLSPISAS